MASPNIWVTAMDPPRAAAPRSSERRDMREREKSLQQAFSAEVA
jgi:hypothetical protein